MIVFRSLAAFVVRQRRAVLSVWLTVFALLLPFTRGVEHRLDTGTRVPGSESARVAELLSSRFTTEFARYAVLVARGIPAPNTESGADALRAIVAALQANSAVSATLSILDVPDTMFVARDGSTFLVVGLRDTGVRTDSIVPSLRATTTATAASLRDRYPRIELLWTGELPLTVDLRRVSADDARRAERRVLPLTLALLVVAFGAVGAAILPVAVGALSIAMTLGFVALLARAIPISILVMNVSTMLGLGLGIDYALLLVSRFREGRARGLESGDAAIDAATHAGHSVALSGAAVLVGYLALLFVPLTDLRSIAIGGALVTTISVLLATTLLPGVLATLGNRVELLPVRRQSAAMRRTKVGDDFWRRWSSVIVRRPMLVLVLAGVPTAALAWQWRRLHAHTPSGDWLPASVESARGLHALREMGRASVVQSVRLILELPDSISTGSETGGRAIRSVAAGLRGRADVARVSLTAASEDEHLVLFDVVPHESPGVVTAMSLARELRQLDAAALAGIPSARLLVGGLPAFNMDYGDAVVKATPRVVILVVLGTFFALAIGFRSVLIPLKAIALNLLAVASAFGAVVLVFLDGHGAGLVGLTTPLDGIFPAVPLLVFCTVFGLSMDYEVFLVSRVAEARRSGMTEREAVVEGVAKTGGVITSAAIVMIVVFGAFTMGEFVLMKILGFALAVAVLLDVTIIRLALGPALLRLAGRWNWWPGTPASTSSPPLRRTPASFFPAPPSASPARRSRLPR